MGRKYPHSRQQQKNLQKKGMKMKKSTKGRRMTRMRRRYKEFFSKVMFTLGDRTIVPGLRHKTVLCSHTWQTIRTLSKDDDDSSENVGKKLN